MLLACLRPSSVRTNSQSHTGNSYEKHCDRLSLSGKAEAAVTGSSKRSQAFGRNSNSFDLTQDFEQRRTSSCLRTLTANIIRSS